MPTEQEQQRTLFQQYLQGKGYQIEQNAAVFEELLNLYLSGEWGETVKTEFMPVWVWQSKIAEKLLEPFKLIGPF